ncbi:MAG: hypothetical protein AB7O62_24390, partial [Pirellulales bacterium]
SSQSRVPVDGQAPPVGSATTSEVPTAAEATIIKGKESTMSYSNQQSQPDTLTRHYHADLDRMTGQTAAERRAEIDRRIDDRLRELGRGVARPALHAGIGQCIQ